MNRRTRKRERSFRILAGTLTLILLAAGPATADLQQRLDQPVTFTGQPGPIDEVFAALSKVAGVRIVVDPATHAALPYGQRTQLDVAIENTPLRAALPGVLAPSGLAWEVDDQAIRVMPARPLARLVRRASFAELKLLGTLMTSEVRQSPESLLAGLKAATDNEDLRMRVELPPRQAAELGPAMAQAASALPMTAADMLDLITRPAGASWYVDGQAVVILPTEAQVRRQLGRVVSVKYQSAPLEAVLLDLARKADVRLSFEPGVLAQLPTAVRERFTLAMADAPIRDALEVVSGSTGLAFVVGGEGISVRPSLYLEVGRHSDGDGGLTAGFYIQTSITTTGGKEIKIFLLPDQLPPELRKAVEAERRRMIDELTRQLAPEAQPTDQ